MSATTVRSPLSAVLVALLVALALWLALARPAAADASVWTDTSSEENVPVRTCAGFDVVTSFTVQREYRVGYPAWDQQRVQFAGAMANATTGTSLAYAGRFTRIVDLDAGTVAIRGLWLQVVPPDQQVPVAPITQVWGTDDNPSGILWQGAVRPAEPIEVVASRIDGDLPASPPAVVLAVGPSEITTRLCELLGGQPLADAVTGTTTPVDPYDCSLVYPRNSRPC